MSQAAGTDPTPDDPAIGELTQLLAGRTVGFIVANEGVEQVELTAPWETIEHHGGRPVLIAVKDAPVQCTRHLDLGDQLTPIATTSDVRAEDFDAFVLPGGVVNADQLRTDSAAIRLVADMVALGRPVAAICHAPWVLIEADVVADRAVTSYPSLRTDLVNAGAIWRDESLVEDAPLITSRRPADLGVFCDAVLHALLGADESR